MSRPDFLGIMQGAADAIDQVRRAFGAPGNHGYERTRQGEALLALYRARAAFPEVGNAPTREGYYWGRWHTPAPGTADDGEPCTGVAWEVHLVFGNSLDPEDPEHLRVMVPGVEKSQPLDAFEWGEEVHPPVYATPSLMGVET